MPSQIPTRGSLFKAFTIPGTRRGEMPGSKTFEYTTFAIALPHS